MGNHYIPRYYQKGFSVEENNEQIYLYRKDSKEWVKTNIVNTGQENDFYSDEVEKRITEEIEQVSNPILEKIRSFQGLSLEEKEIFSRYILVMRHRVPRHKEWVLQRGPEMFKEVIEGIEKELITLQEQHPDKAEIIERRRQELGLLDEKQQRELIENSWLQNIVADTKRPSIQAMSTMTWQFVVPKADSQLFITSDNPVFYFEWLGIARPSSELTFPISKNIALWATWRTDLKEGFVEVRQQFIKEINRRTLSTTRDSVYSSYKADWVIELLNNQEKIHLNRIA